MLFAGSEQLPGALADALRRVDSSFAPFEAVLQALVDVGQMLGERVAGHTSQGRKVIAASPELQERGHAKFAAVADALAAGLVERGADLSTAELVADVGVAIFRRGFDRWANSPHEAGLESRIQEAATQLRAAAAGRTTT